MPVYRVRCSGKSSRAQRRFINPLGTVSKPAPVTTEHFNISHQMKAKGNWLSGLQMGISRHHCFCVGICLIQKSLLQACQQLVCFRKGFTQPQPDICGHLIISRAGSAADAVPGPRSAPPAGFQHSYEYLPAVLKIQMCRPQSLVLSAAGR